MKAIATPEIGISGRRVLPPHKSPANFQLGHLSVPSLLMNLPLSLSAQIPNNILMEGMSEKEREVHLDKAIEQFLALYKYVAQRAIVYLLPSCPGFQDQTYVSNLGVILPHYERDTAIISRFRSLPRIGEERIGADFFRLMGFHIEEPPEEIEGEPVFFEGEADLKHIRDNLYVGAYGMRTSRNALSWASERFEMGIVPFRIIDPYLYHLDCCIFRITEQAVLLCTSVADDIGIQEIERHCEIVDVSVEHARAGITNGLLLNGEILCDSDILELSEESPLYPIEKTKIEFLEKICSRFDRTMRIFCMPEFYKSGAQLSCLVLPIKQTVARTVQKELSAR